MTRRAFRNLGPSPRSRVSWYNSFALFLIFCDSFTSNTSHFLRLSWFSLLSLPGNFFQFVQKFLHRNTFISIVFYAMVQIVRREGGLCQGVGLLQLVRGQFLGLWEVVNFV